MEFFCQITNTFHHCAEFNLLFSTILIFDKKLKLEHEVSLIHDFNYFNKYKIVYEIQWINLHA